DDHPWRDSNPSKLMLPTHVGVNRRPPRRGAKGKGPGGFPWGPGLSRGRSPPAGGLANLGGLLEVGLVGDLVAGVGVVHVLEDGVGAGHALGAVEGVLAEEAAGGVVVVDALDADAGLDALGGDVLDLAGDL